MNTNVKYIVLMTIAMSLIWMVSAVVFMGMIETPNWTDIDPVKLALSSGPFLLVSFLNVLVFAWFVNRTHLTGFSLAFRVFFLLFGVMFFMTQIEIILVELPIEIPLEVVGVTAASGALATLGVAIMAASYRRKLNPPASWGMWVDPSRNVTKLLILAAVYMVLYFVVGYYTAWQVPEFREFYSGSTDIIPIGPHIQEVLRQNIALPVFQIVRGLMWAGIGYSAVVGLGNAKAWERFILVGLILSVGVATPLLISNEFMPAEVRGGHFFELLLKNFIFGVLVALFFRPRSRG
ncbi:hypothetical protein A9Q96_16605 [Rhodobacterales bacterium 52_120_T64]|nr:hypothetical protein A9Q96_16605 [Rhodobacterales bacterium 52_120_T64]